MIFLYLHECSVLLIYLLVVLLMPDFVMKLTSNFLKSSLFLIEYNIYVNQKGFVLGVHSVYVVFFTISSCISTLSYFSKSVYL